MNNQIIIHAAGKQTRIALIENGELAQFFIESPENQRTVGDIYLAEVHKVMSGIRAAFIDLGTPKDAFLHFSDVGDHLEDYVRMLNGDDAISPDVDKKDANDPRLQNLSTGLEKQMRAGRILQPRQRLLVQIIKEPIGSKGPRVSTDITLAGRFLVLVPMGDYVGVSKRIRSYKERRRLRNVVTDNLPEGFGVIVRTVAGGQPDDLVKRDLKDLLKKWESILHKLKTAKPTALLYRDLDMTESLIRDLFAKDYNRVLIDDSAMYKTIKTYVARVAPHLLPSIELFKGSEHIFDYMKISRDVDSIFSPRVKIPSGGYLIFEQTEAMYVIDVNSGRYAANKHQEDNSLKTNLEAAREIAKQLRLRDIGGIIVVDFIDLKDDTNRKKVYDELKKEFKKDRAKTNVLQMSDFGLVQITRQRIRPSVVNSVSRICPMCGGSGSVISQNTILSDIEAWLIKFKHATRYRSVDLYINPYLKSFLTRGFFSQRMRWILKYGIKISMIADDTVSLNDYKFTLSGSDADITDAVLSDKPIDEVIKSPNESVDTVDAPKRSDPSLLEVYSNKKSKDKDNGHKHHHHSHEDNHGSGNKRAKSTRQKESRKSTSRTEKGKAAESASESNDNGSSRSKVTTTYRPSGGKKISKYYKGPNAEDQPGDEGAEGSDNQKTQRKNDTSANSSKQANDTPQEELPRAIEVAKAYKEKMEQQAENGDDQAEPDEPENSGDSPDLSQQPMNGKQRNPEESAEEQHVAETPKRKNTRRSRSHKSADKKTAESAEQETSD